MFSYLRQGWQSWKSAKGVALLAICALAVGIGSTTAIYTVIQAVLLNPFGYQQQDRFLSVWGAFTSRPGWQSSFAFATCKDFAERTRTLDAFGCYATGNFNISYNHQATRAVGTQIDPALVNALGVDPARGHWFPPSANPYSVVLSAALWKRLGSNPDIVGQALTMNGKRYVVTGVMPPWFRLPPHLAENDVWVPLNPDADQRSSRLYNFLQSIAKMKPGVTEAQANTDLNRITLELHHEHPSELISDKVITRTLLDEVVERIRPTLLLLLGAAGVLLLITCANVAGLLLARSVARTRETAVRVALGAARWQLGLHYFSEGLIVSLAGAILGALLSYSLVRIVIAIAAESIPRADEIAVDGRVLLFALLVAVFCGILFSLAPLWQAQHIPPREVLSDGTRASAGAGSRGLLRVFVVSEIALAFGLLTAASLLLYQLENLRRINPGFDTSHLLAFKVFAPTAKYQTEASRWAYESKLIDAIEALPGVESAGFSDLLPLTGWGVNTIVQVEGRPVVSKEKAEAIENRSITPDYFRAMRIPVLKGRVFTARDGRQELPGTMPILINATLARLFWPRGDALGAFVTIVTEDKARFQVAGVVGDARNAGFLQPPRPEIYLNYLEWPPDQMAWIARSQLDEESLIREINRAVLRVDPDQPAYDFRTMESVRENAISREHLQSFMTSFFAIAALLLSMLGVYGVVSYTVRQRTAEIGTRMALGATSRDLLHLVLGDGLKMAAMGIGAGAILVLALTRILSASELLPDLKHVTPFVVPTLVLVALTAVACFFPAWRATLVSPMVAIRNEPGGLWQQTRWGLLRAAEQVSGWMGRADEQAASSESDLLAEIADVSRRAGSFSEAIHAALGCLRDRIHAQSLALFVQREPGHPYRCQGVVPDACADTWMLPADALIVSRLRNYAGALPLVRGDLDASERWAAENAPEHLPEVAQLRELGAALAVRVAVKKETSGILFVGPPEGHPAYNPLERRLLRGVAAQFAMMIENSRLTDRIVEQERLRRELLLATEVQKRLFPGSAPETANLQLAGICIPARGVGGDYYDFIDLGNRNLGIALADVAGKGIAAALVMSVVQASLRSLAGAAGASLAELATKMNRLLHRSTGSNSYATFFYAEVDEQNRELRYVNAGHNPPYLLRGSNGFAPVPFVASSAPIEELATGGTIIGMFAQTAYEEGVVHLEPGDILIAFTDGVPEALNPAEEEYGEDRLKEVLRAFAHLPVNDMAARILQELKNWIADAAQYDDLTFILMKVN